MQAIPYETQGILLIPYNIALALSNGHIYRILRNIHLGRHHNSADVDDVVEAHERELDNGMLSNLGYQWAPIYWILWDSMYLMNSLVG